MLKNTRLIIGEVKEKIQLNDKIWKEMYSACFSNSFTRCF